MKRVRSSEYGRVPEVGGSNPILPFEVGGLAQLLWATSTTSYIVACGRGGDTVEVYTGWIQPQVVQCTASSYGGYHMSSEVLGDHWYLSSLLWKDRNPAYSLPTSPPWYPVQCHLLGLIVHPFGRSCLPLQSVTPPS